MSSDTAPIKNHAWLLVSFAVAAGLFVLLFLSVHFSTEIRRFTDGHAALSHLPETAPWIFFAAIPIWGFYRSLLARPRCMRCRSNNTRQVEDWSEEHTRNSRFELWRVYHCQECGARTAVPAMILGDGG